MRDDYNAAVLVVADLREPDGREQFLDCFAHEKRESMANDLRGESFAYLMGVEVDGSRHEQFGTSDGCPDGGEFVAHVIGSVLPKFLDEHEIASTTPFRIIASRSLGGSIQRTAREILAAMERPAGTMH